MGLNFVGGLMFTVGIMLYCFSCEFIIILCMGVFFIDMCLYSVFCFRYFNLSVMFCVPVIALTYVLGVVLGALIALVSVSC